MTLNPVLRLLAIGTVWPEPGSSAAGVRMLQLLQTFISEGYEVIFASTAQRSDHSFDLKSLGITEIPILLNHASFNQQLEEWVPQVVLFDRFITEEQFGWRVADTCPDAIRILDTEDLHFLRSARKSVALSGKMDDQLASDCETIEDLKNDPVAVREVASVYRCDLTLIISWAEFELLTKHFGIPEALLFYMPYLEAEVEAKVEGEAEGEGFGERRDFVSIGNFLHPPNWDAVMLLKSQIWPEIRRQLPQAELHVYGAYASAKVEQFHSPGEGFHVMGRAGDVDTVLRRYRVMLAPLRFGAGIKGKLVDAFRNGLPAVTTRIGAEGIQHPWLGSPVCDDAERDIIPKIPGLNMAEVARLRPLLIAESTSAFIESAVRLYQNEEVWEKSASEGKLLHGKLFANPEYVKTLLKRISELSGSLSGHRMANFTGKMLMHHTLASSRYMSKWIEEKERNRTSGF